MDRTSDRGALPRRRLPEAQPGPRRDRGGERGARRADRRAGRPPRRPRPPARSALENGRPAVLVCEVDTSDYPGRLRRVPPRGLGARALQRRDGCFELSLRSRRVGTSPREPQRATSRAQPEARSTSQLSRRGEERQSLIQTGSSICFKPYTLEEALCVARRRRAGNFQIVASRAFSSTSIPTGSGPARSPGCRGLLDDHGLRCVSISGHAPAHLDEGLGRLRRGCSPRAASWILSLEHLYTGDAETVEEVETLGRERARAGRRGSGSRNPPLHRDRLESAGNGRGRACLYWTRSGTTGFRSTTTRATSSISPAPGPRTTSGVRWAESDTSI